MFGLIWLASGCVPGGEASIEFAAEEKPTLTSALRTEVFVPSCGKVNACHKGAPRDNATGGLRFDATTDAELLANVDRWSRIVGEDLGLPPMKIVAPGDPDNSYLIVILEGTRKTHIKMDGDGPVTMPFSAKPLSPIQVAAIRYWILSMKPAEIHPR